MWYFQKIDLAQSIIPLKFVAFVGAGGKTSLIECLASNLISRGKTVAITTTTKIYAREPYQVLNDNRALRNNSPLNRFGKTLEDGKLTAVDTEDIQRIGALYDIILIEADGAKNKPLKFPAPYEPVIPSIAEKIFVVSGLDALFHKVREVVFRRELFCNATGIDYETMVTTDVFLRFFSSSILLKGVDTRKCSVILNKYDALEQKRCGNLIARELTKNIKGLEVIISSIKHHIFYRITH
jgi:probable selenium-dependent hydroxylase accessory protein YqeC